MLNQRLIQKTHRVPALGGPTGESTAIARQLDAVLLSVGFKASRGLLEHIGTLLPDVAIDGAVTVISAVRELVGDEAAHNVYFKDFPANVPDTVEFWTGLLARQLAEAGVTRALPGVFLSGVNLLELPGYGTYQHSYAEMLAAHDQFVAALTDRVTVLHLGRSLGEEAERVYLDLAGSRTPLSADDLVLLELLAASCADGEQPDTVPVRENKALINRVRFSHGKILLVDTVTDVLRLAAALSGGDVTLEQPTRFASLSRADRRTLLAALDTVAGDPAKLSDVPPRREAWKRLGERLHPHEYIERYPNATTVFAVARGEQRAQSLASRIDACFAAGDTTGAVVLMSKAPGILMRNVDRAGRQSSTADARVLQDAVADAVAGASGRVLLSLREHLANRNTAPDADAKRIFVGRGGRAWVADESREALPADLVAELTATLDREISSRMPETHHLVVDPAVYRAALPLSGKNTATGYGIMPRGSCTAVTGDHLRFFTHWMQSGTRTDFDLSVLLLDEDFRDAGHVSWTRLAAAGAVHSGDITDAPAPHGASEFIDLDLTRIEAAYVLPQVDIYSGESFTECAESIFGYTSFDAEQQGKPFEPRTVRMKAEVRGTGRVALPLVFARGRNGWDAVWMNLFARGAMWGNRIESNRLSTSLLARTIVGRKYLTLAYLVNAMSPRADRISEWTDDDVYEEPVTFIGLDRPEGLPDGSDVYSLDRWNALVPA